MIRDIFCEVDMNSEQVTLKVRGNYLDSTVRTMN